MGSISKNTLPFPAAYTSIQGDLEEMLWDDAGNVNERILKILSLNVPPTFVADFVCDMHDLVKQMEADGIARSEIVRQILFETVEDDGVTDEMFVRSGASDLDNIDAALAAGRETPCSRIAKIARQKQDDAEWVAAMENAGSAYLRVAAMHARSWSRTYLDPSSASFLDGSVWLEACSLLCPSELTSLATVLAVQGTVSRSFVVSGLNDLFVIPDYLKISGVEFEKLFRDATAITQVSLSRRWSETQSNKEVCEIDVIVDKRGRNPLTEIQRKDLKELITRGLTRAERLILILYYYEEMTMKEIGMTLDLSESRVSQMHSSVLKRLKEQLEARRKELIH